MRPVPDPIYETKREIIDCIFIQMILDQHKRAADARGLAQQHAGILRVVQHVHKEAHVEGTILKRQRAPVESTASDFASGPYHELNALAGNAWSKLVGSAAPGAVAAASIRHGCAWRNLRRE